MPLIGVWLDDALYFATGEDERKAKNLATNAHVTITTGSDDLTKGLDIVVEGEARLVRDQVKVLASRTRTRVGTGVGINPKRPG